MKVLVTGATGFVGSEVTRQLHAAGHRPRLLVRNPNSKRATVLAAQCNADLVPGDVLKSESLERICIDCDAVIHLVGIISEVGGQTYERVHTVATRRIASAASAAGVKRFIQMSALGTRANARSRYHQTKWAAESAVRATAPGWTIFRPSIIYGPGDGFVNLFADMSRTAPAIPLIGGGRTRFQPIPVTDVAKCFVRALAETEAMGQTYDLCGTEEFSLRDIVQMILQAKHRRRLLLSIPFPLARLQATLMELLFNRLLHRAPPLNRDQVTMLLDDNVGDGAPARKLFQLGSTNMRAGIREYL
jgi:NADH dehydrogenase